MTEKEPFGTLPPHHERIQEGIKEFEDKIAHAIEDERRATEIVERARANAPKLKQDKPELAGQIDAEVERLEDMKAAQTKYREALERILKDLKDKYQGSLDS